MNMVETVTAMHRPYGERAAGCFSDPAQTDAGVRRGRMNTIVVHVANASTSGWSPARYCEGVSPTISVNRELNEPSDVQPTAMHVSVTDVPPRSNALARSMRRVIRYGEG